MTRKERVLARFIAGAILLGALVSTAWSQDVMSELARAKGEKCEVYLKSGEVKKGKLKVVGEDYITVEVKLSPFYAEPQTFRLTQVSKVDYGSGVVDVESLLMQNRDRQLAEAAAKALGADASRGSQQSGAAPGRQDIRTSEKKKVESTPSKPQARTAGAPEDETVRRLMAILQSLDEGDEESRPRSQTVQKSGTVGQTRVEVVPKATTQSARTETTSPSQVKSVQSKPVKPVSIPVRKRTDNQTLNPEVTKPGREVPTQPRSATPRSSDTSKRQGEETTRKDSAPVPKPKPTVPVLKPQKTRLASSPDAFADAAVAKKTVGVRPPHETQRAATKEAARDKQEVAPLGAPSSGAERESLAQVARPQSQEADVRTLVNRFYKAAMVLAGAVAFLALGVVFLTVTVVRRRGAVETSGLPAPVADEEPQGKPVEPEEPPLRLVMVKGDYAVVDQGLDQGLRVGDLLMVKRAVADGEYELGLARVLKVFERLSGIKMVEKFVDSELRVGDIAYVYRPAEPSGVPETELPAQTVREVPNEATNAPGSLGKLDLDSTEEDYDDLLDQRYLPSRGRWRHR